MGSREILREFHVIPRVPMGPPMGSNGTSLEPSVGRPAEYHGTP